MSPLRGVYNILTTPFLPNGALDEASLRRLTDAVIAAEIDGLTVLGVAGEAQKLTDAERQRVLAVVFEAVDGRLPVVVGASRDGTDATIAAGREAAAAGAAALMIAPPTFAQPGAALTEHYGRVADTVPLPIVLQDYPPANGVALGPRDMADLVRAVPAITTIKLEDPPTPQRVGQTLALLDGAATILGGLGGVYLLDELRRGASGTMTGFSYPELLVAICRAEATSDRRLATELFYRSLPLLVFEGQPRIGLAIRKAILRRRGLIDHATVRQPGPRLDDGTLADLDETLAVLAASHGRDVITAASSAPRS